jgi:acyl-CoA dehydrogenase
MDFNLSEEQQAIRDLSAQIFQGRATPERVRVIERTEERIDRELWSELARANLLGIALPEDVGGSGLGLVELALLLEEQGRRVAPVPLLATVVMGALPFAEFGTAEQRTRWLPGVIAGEVVLTAALAEMGDGDPSRPSTTAVQAGDGWRLDGLRMSVPAAHVAARILVPARHSSGVGVFVVDPSADGVQLQRAETTNREIHSHLVLDGAPAEALGDPQAGETMIKWMVERAIVGIAALQVGVAEDALRQAAQYTSERVQFGRQLSTFQGAAIKAADGYIDCEAMRVTMWQAAWRLSAGYDATAEVEVAKWWAAEGGQRVVHATQHLHGGLGADVEYPVHRYFLWGKQLEDMLGGAGYHLARLGRHLAASGAGAGGDR